ncbi:DUF948 domain-containing protein [Peribacillus frigoritolerans]|uniref:DUF948 domain-containing protein n=1 Tax=Peribacillus frigoritolerans TaxID=450367 RepID=UPI002B249D04|nr:DUF948 domain-containing protein [Peribacillus frigoritolerans]MEB2627884.1 DUF948 domain-containing protein [Peribacillus frigoritolerans]
MKMFIKLSVASVSGAVVYLIYNVNQTLRKGMGTLEETNKTLEEVRNAVHGLTQESKQLIHSANQITADVKGKMENVDPLLESAQDVGEMIHNVTNSMKEASLESRPKDLSKPSAPSTRTKGGGVQIKLK